MNNNDRKGVILLMNNDNAIISTALLSMYFEKHKKDNLDLLIPFIMSAIHNIYSINQQIEISVLCDYMIKEYGFESCPDAVILKIINRIVKNNSNIKKDNKNYFYVETFAKECESFKRKRDFAGNNIKDLIDDLTIYVNNKDGTNKDKETIKKMFFAFFDKYGLPLMNMQLEAAVISPKQDHYYYLISRYIIEEKEKKSVFFNKILELFKGFLLSKAIYLQPDNSNLYKANLSDLKIYLDTPLILRILGLRSEIENRKAKQFFELLPNKTKLFCFSHTMEELETIIRAYSHNLENGTRTARITLEYFDNNNSSYIDVLNYNARLERNLNFFNIYIDEKNYKSEISINYVKNGVFLKERLIENMNYKENAMEKDIISILGIKQIRGDKRVSSVEKAKAIFVTSNSALCRLINEYFKDLGTVPIVMTDVEFSILLWLKIANTQKNYPEELLVTNAISISEEITESFFNGVMGKVEMYKKDGKFDEYDASLVRENVYIQKELLEKCNKDPSALTEEDILEVKEDYKKKYAEELGYDNYNVKKENDLLKTKIDQVKTESVRNSLAIIKSEAQKHAKKAIIIKFIYIALIAFLMVFSLIFGIKSIIDSNTTKIFANAILLILSILGVLDMFINKMKLVEKLYKKIESHLYSTKYDKLLKEYNIQ